MQFTNPCIRFSDLRYVFLEYRYVPALKGVVVAHENVKFLGTVATIKADCPFANCRVSFDTTVWSPRIGMKLCESFVILPQLYPIDEPLTYANRSGKGQPLFT